MIVKNEEKTLGRCLKSTRDLFDEIIIVDTGSNDKTKEITSNFTKNIYEFKWIDDFSAARNYSFSKATKEYVMWLDADDVIKKGDYKKLKKLKKEMDKNIDIIMLKYHTSFDSQGKPNFSYYRERIMKRKNNYKWQDRVHEYITLTGNITREDIAITHSKEKHEVSTRNLNIYEEMEKDNIDFTPRNLYYYGRELSDHHLYQKSIKVLKKFLKTKKGWIEDNINACIIIYNAYLKLDKPDQALDYLFQTFKYDLPRSKACCLIGHHYLNNNQYEKAIYWYLQAINTSTDETNGFYEKDYKDFIPLINITLCYDRLGNIDLAKQFHEIVKKVKPNDPSVIHNEKYFSSL